MKSFNILYTSNPSTESFARKADETEYDRVLLDTLERPEDLTRRIREIIEDDQSNICVTIAVNDTGKLSKSFEELIQLFNWVNSTFIFGNLPFNHTFEIRYPFHHPDNSGEVLFRRLILN